MKTRHENSHREDSEIVFIENEKFSFCLNIEELEKICRLGRQNSPSKISSWNDILWNSKKIPQTFCEERSKNFLFRNFQYSSPGSFPVWTSLLKSTQMMWSVGEHNRYAQKKFFINTRTADYFCIIIQRGTFRAAGGIKSSFLPRFCVVDSLYTSLPIIDNLPYIVKISPPFPELYWKTFPLFARSLFYFYPAVRRAKAFKGITSRLYVL